MRLCLLVPNTRGTSPGSPAHNTLQELESQAAWCARAALGTIHVHLPGPPEESESLWPLICRGGSWGAGSWDVAENVAVGTHRPLCIPPV